MPQAKSSLRRAAMPILLSLGLATMLTACNVHDSGRRGPAYYSERQHWDRGDRDRRHWRNERHYRQDDHRRADRDRHRRGDRDRRHWEDR